MILRSSTAPLGSHITSCSLSVGKWWQQGVKSVHWCRGSAGKGAQVYHFFILVYAMEVMLAGGSSSLPFLIERRGKTL